MRQGFARQKTGRDDVERQQIDDRLLLGLGQRHHRCRTGVVDQVVEASPPLHGGVHHLAGRLVTADVDGQDVDMGVGRGGLLQERLAAAHGEDVRTRLGEGHGGGSADAGSRAGDDHNVTGERLVGLVRGHQGSLFDVRCT